MNSNKGKEVRYPPRHQPLSPHSSANLIELTITFPSPWYLITSSDADPTAVPRDLLQMYVARAIADKRQEAQAQARLRGVVMMAMTDSPSPRHGDANVDNHKNKNNGNNGGGGRDGANGGHEDHKRENKEDEVNTPHTSAWRMAGDVLRLVADTLDRERIKDDAMITAADGGTSGSGSSHRQDAGALFCLYTSDRFRLTWRPLDSMPTSMGVSPITTISTSQPTPAANTRRDDNTAATSAKHAEDIAVLESLIAHRDGQIATLEEDLRGREEGIRGREGTIRELKGSIGQRDSEIAVLEKRLWRRDEQKGKLNKALQEAEALRAELCRVQAQAQLNNSKTNDKDGGNRNSDDVSLFSNSEHNADDAKKSAAPASSSASAPAPASTSTPAPTNTNTNAPDELTKTLRSQLAAKNTLIAQQATRIGMLRSVICRLEYEAKTVDALRKECQGRELGAGEMPEPRARKEKFVEALVASDERLRRGRGQGQMGGEGERENRRGDGHGDGGVEGEGEVTESEVRFSVGGQ